jgi:universal stress protein A
MNLLQSSLHEAGVPGAPGDSVVRPFQRMPAWSLKTLLVPTDFSEHSESALRYSRWLAQQLNACILLFHVAEVVCYGDLFAVEQNGELETSLMEQARLELVSVAVPKGDEAGRPVEVETQIRVGIPDQQIVEVARELNADLIVLARRGISGGLVQALLGGTAEQVVRHAPCPVLVVPESPVDWGIAREGAPADRPRLN